MPDAPQAIVSPPLRTLWSTARKAGEATAKTLKQDKEFTTTRAKMKGDLGPDLESWPKFYPDFTKLKTAKDKIDGTIKQYSEAIKGSHLDDKVKNPMLEALKKVKTAMNTRLDTAEKLIGSDEKLAIKDSLKKQISPLVIFKQDVGKAVAEAAGKDNKTLTVESIPLEVILTDPAVLKHVPNDLDDAVLAKEIREAADYHGLIQQLAKLLIEVSKDVHAEKDVPAAEKKFAEGLDKAVEAALTRAAKPILELVHVRSDYRMYKVKAGAKLVATGVGIVGSAAALASAPITTAAGVVVGLYGLAQASISFGTQIAKLALEAEDFAGKVSADLKKLNDQYKEHGKTVVGTAEVAKAAANALLPAAVITSITSVKGDCDQLNDKINGLTTGTHDGAQDLGKLLTKQAEAQTALNRFEQITRGKLTPPELQGLQKAMKKLDELAVEVDKSIKAVDRLSARAKLMRNVHTTLAAKVNALASGKPGWAEVGELVVNVAVSAGFLAAGNTNLPDPFKGLETFNTVTTWIGNSAAIASTLKDTVEGIKGQVEKRKG